MPYRLNSIQLLRALAAIAVVLYHLMSVERKFSNGYIAMAGCFKIGATGVDLFFVISGFIMAYITHNTWGSKGTIKFLSMRIVRIIPVYWVYSFVTLCVYLIIPNSVNSSEGGQFNIFTSIFLLPSKNLPLVMVGWSLVFEVYFYIIFSVLIRFREKTIVYVLFVWALIIVVFNLMFDDVDNYLVSFYTNPYSLEFIIGVFSFLLYKRLPSLKIAILPIFSTIISFVFIYYSNVLFNENQLTHVISLGISFGLLLLSCVYLEEQYSIEIPRICISIGDASFSIYLSHILVINAIGKYISEPFYSQRNIWVSWSYIILTLVIVISFSLISYVILEKMPYRYIASNISKKFENRSVEN